MENKYINEIGQVVCGEMGWWIQGRRRVESRNFVLSAKPLQLSSKVYTKTTKKREKTQKNYKTLVRKQKITYLLQNNMFLTVATAQVRNRPKCSPSTNQIENVLGFIHILKKLAILCRLLLSLDKLYLALQDKFRILKHIKFEKLC